LKEEEDENLIVERLDPQSEGYVSNQVLPLFPNKEGQLRLSYSMAE
jgi:hypothetical protein